MKAFRMRQSSRKGSVATGFILMEPNTHISSQAMRLIRVFKHRDVYAGDGCQEYKNRHGVVNFNVPKEFDTVNFADIFLF
jgi:hypothetical protein